MHPTVGPMPGIRGEDDVALLLKVIADPMAYKKLLKGLGEKHVEAQATKTAMRAAIE